MSGSSLVVVIFSNILKCLDNDPSKKYQELRLEAPHLSSFKDISSRNINAAKLSEKK